MAKFLAFSMFIACGLCASDYIYVSERKNWADANAYCLSTYGVTLAIIDRAADNNRIRGKISSDTWIGASDTKVEGQWTWADGSAITYNKWGRGEPNNYGGREDCGKMNVGGGWNDVPCEWVIPFVCDKKDPTVSPTSMPSESPTVAVMLIDNVCELLDIDFFLGTCSLHHGNLKTNLASNDANDLKLKDRVKDLENTTSANKALFESQTNNLQAQITALKNTIKTSFSNLATSLGNLGATNPAKAVPIFGDDGEIIAHETLFFTTLQAQYLVIISLLINAILILKSVLECLIKYPSNSGTKKQSYRGITMSDSSDSEAFNK